MARSVLSTVRIVLWTLVAVALAAVVGYTYWPRDPAPGPAVAAVQYGAGDYEVVTTEGETVDDSIFVGQPSAVFFGFTHCPDVCPTTLGEMSLWFSELGAEADDLQAFFVTVDPERDTVEVLDQYVGWASDRITGITGDPDEIAEMVAAWGVYAEQIPLEDGGYTMDHTASVFLIDEEGQFQGTIAYGEPAQTAIDKLRLLINGRANGRSGSRGGHKSDLGHRQRRHS